MLHMLQKSNTSRVEEVFFISPTKEHYLMDISRNVKLAHTSVKRNLKKLVRDGLIKELLEKRGKRKFPIYKANLGSKLYKIHKIVYNFSSLFQSGLIEFIEGKLSPKSIVLFGSFQRGEDTENSDIDLFVECKKKDLDFSDFEKKLKRKVEIHFNEDFTSYSKELKNNIINGVILSGFLEGYK